MTKVINLGRVVGVDGKDGVGISDVVINDAGELVITYSNGESANLGKIINKDFATKEDLKDIIVPTNTSDLQNDSGFLTANRYTNVSVPVSSFIEDTTFEDYLFKADILIEGVTVNDYANIIFALSDVQSKNYAPICITNENVVSIYAVEVPSADITIPLIEVIKV